jgi:glutamate synthase domain-containing protein 1
MCGIVGLFLKNPALEGQLGALFTPMLVEMTDRGPDSAGIAIYHDAAPDRFTKITAFHPDPRFDWETVCDAIRTEFNATVKDSANDSHIVIRTDADPKLAAKLIERADPRVQIMSVGTTIEIYKEMGLPGQVAGQFKLNTMSGTHAVGHTRMATESAVTTAGSHPFSTGLDLCLVHNGSLSNHNRLRERLHDHEGMEFKTENDTEVAAAYIANRLNKGRSLHDALEDCLSDLDGFYTFVAGTHDGFAVLRDPIACKPAVLAETDDYVAFGSEYRALVGLPGIDNAKVWEPEPAVVYSWGGRA